MTTAELLLGLLCALGMSAGQVFFKLAALSMPPIHGNSLLLQILKPQLLTALLIYAFTTGLWLWLLRLVPLNRAYPFMALAFLFVPLLGAVFLNEKLELKNIAGGLLILLGVYISTK
jgi:drug/metabolite transporter (DMT)-like permease